MKWGTTSKGFTLMEILVSVALISIVCFLAFTSFSRFRSNALINETKEEIQTTLSQARSLTLSSRSDTVYGVHLEATKMVLFKGSSYATTSASNIVTTFDPRVKIASIRLTGGKVNVLFTRLTGETSQVGTITIQLTSESDRRATTTILTSGIIE